MAANLVCSQDSSVSQHVVYYAIYVYYERFEVFTAVTKKIVVFWDIKAQVVPHRRNITSPLLSSAC
jgi:hypothetical protein